MGNHSKPSVARARLSTLAVTTSLGVVGAGVLTGTANAATGPTSGDGTTASLTATPGDQVVAGASTTTVHLDASASTIGHGPAAASMYTFHCDATDTVHPTNINTAGDQADCVYPAVGSYGASVVVDDGHKSGPTPDGKSIANQPITVFTPAGATTAVAPALTETAALTVHADFGTSAVGANIDFSKSVVKWGDGKTSPVVVGTDGKLTAQNHTYSTAGSYQVAIDLYDAGAATPTSTATSAAIGVGDIATVQVPSTAHFGTTVTADLAGTQFDVNDGVTKSVSINWGDGKSDGPAADIASLVKTHVYANVGNYNVVVTVDDGNGHQTKSGATAAPISINASPVQASIHGKQIAPYTIVADLTGSSVDAAATNPTYTIHWGDQTTDTVLQTAAPTTAPTHNYHKAGTFTLTVTVDDGHGNVLTSPNTYTVTVDATQPAPPIVARGWGKDRYLTGVAVSAHHWADKGVATDTKGRVAAKAVVLATGGAFPDALAGVPLAKKAQGPLLLTDGSQGTVDSRVLGEIQRILPTSGTTLYILGGTHAVSQGIQDQLTGLGYNVLRLYGADRFGTALDIANRGMGDPTHVIVARGDQGANNDGFADALVAGPYAANIFGGGNSAIVLANNTTLDANTKTYVAAKLAAPHAQNDVNVAAIGGQAVTAVGSIPGSAGLFGQAKGKDRFDTAAQVAKAFPVIAPLGVAYGFKFPDALTGGALMAVEDGPLLLTDTSAMSPYTIGAIGRVAASTPEIDVFGGPVVVSDVVLHAIANQVNQSVIGQF